MMKKILLMLLTFCFSAGLINAQTSGTLSVSVATSSTGGNFAPKNIVAIWIEDNSGKFVKTLLAYANTRKAYLNTWKTSTTTAGSAYNTTDAVSGATQSSHATRICTWNGTDYSGKQVADGDYKVRMELTDKNATGNIASYTFTKGATTQKLSPADVPSFSSVVINWTTTVTGIDPELIRSSISVYPNPGSGQFNVKGENFQNLKVTNIAGKIVLISQFPSFDISNQPNGIYFVSVITSQITVVKKIIKN